MINVEEILELHSRLLQRFGGAVGVRDMDVLRGVLASPYGTFDGQEFYPTVADKAVHLCCEMVRQHPFVDGNKRVGAAAMLGFLRKNGLVLRDDPDNLYSALIHLITHEIDEDAFRHYVCDHLEFR